MKLAMMSLSLRGDGEGEQRDVARALDGEGDFALMQSAVATDAARNDLAALRDEVFQSLRILVVDDERFVGAVATNALAARATTTRSVGVEIGSSREVPIVHVDVAVTAGVHSS